jgi:hypothetical protein
VFRLYEFARQKSTKVLVVTQFEKTFSQALKPEIETVRLGALHGAVKARSGSGLRLSFWLLL